MESIPLMIRMIWALNSGLSRSSTLTRLNRPIASGTLMRKLQTQISSETPAFAYTYLTFKALECFYTNYGDQKVSFNLKSSKMPWLVLFASYKYQMHSPKLPTYYTPTIVLTINNSFSFYASHTQFKYFEKGYTFSTEQ